MTKIRACTTRDAIGVTAPLGRTVFPLPINISTTVLGSTISAGGYPPRDTEQAIVMCKKLCVDPPNHYWLLG
jgi:hypothetical protein